MFCEACIFFVLSMRKATTTSKVNWCLTVAGEKGHQKPSSTIVYVCVYLVLSMVLVCFALLKFDLSDFGMDTRVFCVRLFIRKLVVLFDFSYSFARKHAHTHTHSGNFTSDLIDMNRTRPPIFIYALYYIVLLWNHILACVFVCSSHVWTHEMKWNEMCSFET